MLYLALIIAIIALIGVVYGVATGFTDMTNPEAQEAAPRKVAADSGQRKLRGKRIFWYSAVIFILVALWYGFFYESPRDIEQRQARETEESCTDVLAAYNVSQGFVRQFVHNGPSATFPIIPKPESEATGQCRFAIQAVVFDRTEAGEVKLPYEADLHYDADKELWQLTGLTLDGQTIDLEGEVTEIRDDN